MLEQAEFLYGYYFDSGEQISSLSNLDASRPYWLHFDYTKASTQKWLAEQSQLDEVIVNALLNEETRPRATGVSKGALVSLRGVNLAPNSDPEDMVSVRLWFNNTRVISTRRRSLLSAGDIAAEFDRGQGPKSPTEFVTKLTERLIARMSNTIYEIEDRVAEIEESILVVKRYEARNELADARRQIISLRRYLSPQREAMNQLLGDKFSLFTLEEKIQLRETTDCLTRFIEDLESIKDRAIVSQEELNNALAEHMNNRMYVLSIVAAIFLPLGFLTGLLGINVGGIPGAENPSAFVIFILLLILVVALQIWLFKRKKWF